MANHENSNVLWPLPIWLSILSKCRKNVTSKEKTTGTKQKESGAPKPTKQKESGAPKPVENIEAAGRLSEFLEQMKSKYGENLYKDMEDSEIEKMESLERALKK